MKPKYSYKTLTRAQSLRRDMTDAEIKLWSILRWTVGRRQVSTSTANWTVHC